MTVVRLISRSAVIIHWPLDDQNVVDMKSRSLLLPLHLIGFSDLVGLWVIKIKKPMILCARSTPRSREQSTKRSENTWKVCLFDSQNNKISMIIKHGRHFFRNSGGAQRIVGFFPWLCYSGADWLGRQTVITWLVFLYEVFSEGEDKLRWSS